ncbi:MAG: Fic family protein [Pseudomonadota bacterium]
MTSVGYTYLAETLGLDALPLKRVAQVMPATRIHLAGNVLAVPAGMAPSDGNLLEQLLFALKHEGINLSLLAQVMPHIPAEQLTARFEETPSGIYLRKACFLWEAFNNTTLATKKPARGRVEPLFDPARYVTGEPQRVQRWRIDFNGLGNLNWCATVERTEKISALLNENILLRAQEFMATLPEAMIDRAIQWAYLHETRSSFAIEKETPSPDKAERFMQLLKQAQDGRPLSEDYFVGLQNNIISNVLDHAAAFRHEQNHLSNGRGALGVTYVPPPPELCRELMVELMRFANDSAQHTEPLVAAAITSFGFVFLHPFMDGNGRLSRFLIHQTLCRAGVLKNGLLLPVSVAMQHEEARYLATLQSFSRPIRDFWAVKWIDADMIELTFKGSSALYRYWDATACVEFTLDMAKRALEVELREETVFLARYDRIIRLINAQYDVRGSDLSKLVIMCLDNQGQLSLNRRKQFRYVVSDDALSFIEASTQQVLEDASGST